MPASREPHGPTRRHLLGAAGALGAALPLALAGCGGGSKSSGGSANQKVELSVMWWGAATRADITAKVLDLYKQRNPNVSFKTQWQGSSTTYYDKLSTMAAGGSAPDLFQIDDNALAEYTNKGIALDLTKYVGQKINVDRFPASLKSSGAVKGRVGGIAAAENTPALYIDETVVKTLGLTAPALGQSWDQLVQFGSQVFTRSAGKTYGTMNPAADYKALQVWLRQQDKELYTPDGAFAFTVDDLTAWFAFWADADAKKATPPPDLVHIANTGDVTKQVLATKKGATSFLWSNQLAALSKATDHDLGILPYPGDPKGQWARASMYWSGFSGSKHPDTIADLINFLVNDPDAGKILGAERGLAPNLDVRAAITSTLKKPDQTSTAFESGLADKFGPTPPVPPKGHVQVKKLLVDAAESVGFKKAAPAAAAASFMSQGKAAISA
ncbi:MAG TPA: extracellular solute-binding protein [Rugosimonospora sp.]|nr:extracellular solute-binding protein [Rugosimonospora sp.]